MGLFLMWTIWPIGLLFLITVESFEYTDHKMKWGYQSYLPFLIIQYCTCFSTIFKPILFFYCNSKLLWTHAFMTMVFAAKRLHDIDVKVGNSTRRMRMCGHVSGDTGLGGRMAVFCPTPTVGRYVQIQIVKGDTNYLTPAEVVVWGVRVGYYYREHWDHDF